MNLSHSRNQANQFCVNFASYIHNKKNPNCGVQNIMSFQSRFCHTFFSWWKGELRCERLHKWTPAHTWTPAWPFDTRLWPVSLGQPGCNPAVLPDRQSRPGQGCLKTWALSGKLTGREGRGVQGVGDGAACSGSGHCGAQLVDTLPWGKQGQADRQLAAACASIARSSLPPPAFQRWCSLGLCPVCAGGSEGSPREQVCLCLLFYIQLHPSLLICVNMLSTPHVLGLPDAMPQREAMGVRGTYSWRKSSPRRWEEGDWTRTRDSPYNILVELGNAVVKQKISFSLAQKKYP